LEFDQQILWSFLFLTQGKTFSWGSSLNAAVAQASWPLLLKLMKKWLTSQPVCLPNVSVTVLDMVVKTIICWRISCN